MAVVSYDTETTGLYPFLGDEMFAFSTCDEKERTSVVRTDGSKTRQRKGLEALEKIWSRKKLGKAMHNAKFDLEFTEKKLGRQLEEHPIHDTMVMSHILRNNRPSHALKKLCHSLADYPFDDETLIKKYTRGGKSFQEVPEKYMRIYQERDAERTMLLYLFFHPLIQENPDFREIYQMEMDLIWTTMRMEGRGIMVNQNRCHKLIARLEAEVEDALKDIKKAARGREINPDKPADLSWLLYKKLKLPILEVTAKTKAPSTKKEVLMQLREQTQNPILNLVMKVRSYGRAVKILSSYLDFCDSNSCIHPKIHTNGAVSSRESCSEPNLQNVAKKEVLMNPFPVPARDVFQPKPGMVNFHLDYSGIEMRLLVHYSEDKKLIDMMNAGRDMHVAGAQIFFPGRWKKSNDKARKILRDGGKHGGFGIAYGASAKKICESLGLPIEKGRARYQEYKKRFPGLGGLANKCREIAQDQGYIATAFGRRLHVPDGKAYIATNYLIQGTAAGILKRAQNRVHHYLREATGGEAGLLLPIHDEIVIEYPRKRLKDSPEILGKIR